jgi:hypothetical protein
MPASYMTAPGRFQGGPVEGDQMAKKARRLVMVAILEGGSCYV